MVKQVINIGVEGNDATGDAIRDSFRKVNENFNELYSIVGTGDGIPFTSLSDYDPDRDQALVPETVFITNQAGSLILAKKLVSGDTDALTINLNGIDPISGEPAIVLNSRGGKLKYDLHPQLGGDLDGQGSFFVTNILDPDHPNASNIANIIGTTVDTFAVTKGYSDDHYVNADGDTMTGHLNVPTGAAGSQVPQKQEVVGRAGGETNRMTGPLLLDSDPIPSSDDLTAVTKHYVDVNSFASTVNFFVSVDGRTALEMDAADVPDSKKGRAYAYAFSSVSEACQWAEDAIYASSLEPGPYKQAITYGAGASQSVVNSITNVTVSGVALVRVAITNLNGTSPVDQGDPTNIDLNSGKLIIGAYSGAVGTIYTYRGVQSGYDEIDIKMVSGTFQITEKLYFDNATPKIQISVNIESGIYEEHLPIRVPRNVSIIGDEMRRTIIRPLDAASASPWKSLYFYRDTTIDGLTTAASNYGYHYMMDSSREMNIGPSYTNVGGYSGAALLILSNKEFIQAEVNAYMTEVLENTTFNETLSSRDVGLVVDAIHDDLIASGNARVLNAASRYYGTAISAGNKADCLAGIEYINTLAQKILTKTVLDGTTTPPKRGLVSQQITGTVEAGAGAVVEDLVGTVAFGFDEDFNPPKNNKDMDLFLMNDATGLKDFTMQGHGGFAVVLDPEGQILTKSPYMQNCSSIAASVNKKAFRGGAFIDGYCGRMPVTITTSLTGAGVTELNLSGLTFPLARPLGSETYRRPNTPTAFWVNGQRFRIEKIVAYDDELHTATVTLGDTYSFLNTDIELETAGNRSILATHFTQVNDLGYGILGTNNALIELVSVFTYYNHTAYYALNGAQIRGVSGSNSNGFYGLKSEGSDPGEVPRSVMLADNMTQIARIYKQGSTYAGAGYNAAGGSYATITGFDYIPYSDTELQVLHPDPNIGMTKYAITSATPVTNTSTIAYIAKGGTGIATITTTTAHGLQAGDSVTLAGIPSTVTVNGTTYSTTEFNGTFTVTNTGPNGQTASATFNAGQGGAINTASFQVTSVLNSPTLLNVTNGSFVVGNRYVISALGTTTSTQWNTIAGTVGQAYNTGTVFTAAAVGSGTGSGTAYQSPFQIGQSVSGYGIPITAPSGATLTVFIESISNLSIAGGVATATIGLTANFTAQASGTYTFVPPSAGTQFNFLFLGSPGFVRQAAVSNATARLNTKIVMLSLGTGIGGSSTFKENLSHGDYVVLRTTQNFKFYGDFTDLSARPSTALDFTTDGSTGTYRTVDLVSNYYNNSDAPGDANYAVARSLETLSGVGDATIVTVDANYSFITCQLTSVAVGGNSTLQVTALTADEAIRIVGMEFGWADQNVSQKGFKRTITSYTTGVITLNSALPTDTLIPSGTTLMAGLKSYASTTLATGHAIGSSDVMTGAGVIYLTNASGFADNGIYPRYIRIDNEYFSYTDVVGNTLTGVTRKRNGSIAAAHTVGTSVKEVSGLLTANISTCRVTSHDFLNIGTGGYNTSNYPANIFGVPKQAKVSVGEAIDDAGTNAKAEVQEKNKGRVFFASTNQDGFFRVGRFFSVDQGTGTVELKATLALSNISGLGFKKGVVIQEFSNASSMPDSSTSVPTSSAVRGYINRRLGLDGSGNVVSSGDLIGPGFMPRDGSLAATDTMDLDGNRIANVGLPSDTRDATPKQYVDLFLKRSGGTRTGMDMFIMSDTTTLNISSVERVDVSSIKYAIITTTSAHALSVGSIVTVADVTITGFNAIGAVVTAVTDTTFRYVNTGSIVAATAVYGATVIVDSNIGMNNNKITNLATPTADYDATNKLYVDTKGNIANLGDVTLTGAAANNLFAYNGTKWVNAALAGDITATLSGNTLTSAIGSGKITNTMVSASAAIVQSKLSMTAASTRANATSIAQADLGLASFDSAQFTATNGWITVSQNGLALDRLAQIGKNYLIGNVVGPASRSPELVSVGAAVEAAITSPAAGAIIRGGTAGNFTTTAVSASASASSIVQRTADSHIQAASMITTAGLVDTTGTASGAPAGILPTRITNPGGGALLTQSQSPIGYIKIKLPTATLNSSTMIRMTVKIYDYNGAGNAGTATTIELGGYNNNSDAMWYGTFATQTTTTGQNLNVRFGLDGTSNCIWIGNSDTVWSYPQVYITDIQLGLSNTTPSLWSTGWVISITTSIDTVKVGPYAISKTWMHNVNNLPAVNDTYSLGSTSFKMANVYSTNFVGTATQAKYADLAERYAADKEYEVGTVLMIGGDYEVTLAKGAGTTKVAGVVSEHPAYLMNSEIEAEFPATIALQGRVPCKVIGKISKGDLLVVGMVAGVAMATEDAKAGSIIGKALADYNSDRIGIIEVLVGKH